MNASFPTDLNIFRRMMKTFSYVFISPSEGARANDRLARVEQQKWLEQADIHGYD
ncbi:hypothetical protein HHL24_34150 [Paraburkholderia sp. RP-4-7]|uniref:Uncharacterized protein n=1 Tax=Paraburkholderia polaris TaxID=2728848 RepID=A0A848ISZ7_9BURK|nr:hypothetical protein [Paraburkholderia polaris]